MIYCYYVEQEKEEEEKEESPTDADRAFSEYRLGTQGQFVYEVRWRTARGPQDTQEANEGGQEGRGPKG